MLDAVPYGNFFSFLHFFITVRCRIVTLHFTVIFHFFSFFFCPVLRCPALLYLPSFPYCRGIGFHCCTVALAIMPLSFFLPFPCPPSARIDLREWRHVCTRASWVLYFAFATPIPVHYIISYHSIASYDTDADAETETDTGDASSACVGYVWLCFAVQYSAMLCSIVR